jgi:hypothetical protein
VKVLTIVQENHPGLLAEVTTLLEREGIGVQDFTGSALAELSRRLAEANVDVRGMHIVNKDAKAGIVALETADHQKAREILQDILL